MARRQRFEEKSYEIAYCVELASGSGGSRALFSPGQVLEKLLGFDAAAAPGPSHVLWRVLGLPRPPGLSLLPGLWAGGIRPPSATLPRYPVSVFLQFKRPDYRHGANARQYRLWGGPYYRFERTNHQHTVLTRLERNLAAQAVVRYAAPAFDTVAELEAAQLTGSVVTLSGHVGPGRLGRHKVWTYQRPGSYGIPNPSGDPIAFEPFEEILGQTVDRENQQRQVEPYVDEEIPPLLRHLGVIGAVCRAREPRLRATVGEWARGLPALDLEAASISALIDFATVQSLVARERATWWLTG